MLKTITFSFFFVLCCLLPCFQAEKVQNEVLDKKRIELSSTSSNSNSVQKSVWNCKALHACDDKLGFEAISILHQRLDDDADGNIDIDESNEFLRDELKYGKKSGYERQKLFHRNDKHISVDELWSSWRASEVHNWTKEETIQWLVSYVDLPQYEKNFKDHSVDGTALSRLAVNNNHFLSNLGIKDPIHKHKISLKAMDVVLFGTPKDRNYYKNVILALSVCLATGGCWFAFVQHKRSQSHILKTMRDMESLQHAEEALSTLQKELDKAKLEQEIVITEKRNLEQRLKEEIIMVKHQDSSGSTDSDQSKIHKLEEELSEVIEELRLAEQALQAKQWLPSPVLQHWLQLTHELELQHYNQKKAAAEKQLLSAKEGCEKLSKKRTSFMGAFRVAHSSAINDVDNRILQAKTALSEVTKDLQERLSRWKEIENLCGFSIVHNPGIRHLENLLEMPVKVAIPSNATARLIKRNSDGALSDTESLAVSETGVSARSMANIPYYCSQRGGFSPATLTLPPSMPLSDLKTISSANAILQRSNAFSVDHMSDVYVSETHSQVSIENVRPVFTVGDSKDDSSPCFESSSKNHTQETI